MLKKIVLGFLLWTSATQGMLTEDETAWVQRECWSFFPKDYEQEQRGSLTAEVTDTYVAAKKQGKDPAEFLDPLLRAIKHDAFNFCLQKKGLYMAPLAKFFLPLLDQNRGGDIGTLLNALKDLFSLDSAHGQMSFENKMALLKLLGGLSLTELRKNGEVTGIVTHIALELNRIASFCGWRFNLSVGFAPGVKPVVTRVLRDQKFDFLEQIGAALRGRMTEAFTEDALKEFATALDTWDVPPNNRLQGVFNLLTHAKEGP